MRDLLALIFFIGISTFFSCRYEKAQVIKNSTQDELIGLMSIEKYDNNDDAKALEIGEYAIKKYNSYLAAKEMASIYLHRKKDYENALKYYQLSLELGADTIHTYNRLARTYYESGQFDKAREYYVYVLNNYDKKGKELTNYQNEIYIDTEFKNSAQFYLAKTYHFLGDNDQALNYFDEAIAYYDSSHNSGSDEVTHFSFAHYCRANTRFLLGDTSGAIADYNLAATDLADRITPIKTDKINSENIEKFKFGSDTYYQKVQ